MQNYIKKCPECGGIHLVLHKEKGEVVCKDCGLVIEEKMIDFGQEWREFDPEQADKRRRTGAPSTWSVDYNEPIIIENEDETKIVKIGEFINNLIDDNKGKVELMCNNLEVLQLNKEIKVASFENEYEVGFRRVSEVSRHPAEEMFEIHTETGRRVIVTGNHSVFTVKDNKVIPVKVDSLEESNFIVAPRILPVNEIEDKELNLFEKFFEVSDNYKNIYLRNFSDENTFKILKLKYGSRAVKDWRRHKTVPLYALNSINFRLKNAENLEIGIYSSNNSLPLKIKIDESFCRLLGFYASEGTSRPNSIVFSFGSHELAYIS